MQNISQILSSPHHQESTILAYNKQNRINKLFAADRLGKRTICQDLLAIFFLNSILPSSPPTFSLHNDLGGDGQWCQRHISCGSGRRQLTLVVATHLLWQQWRGSCERRRCSLWRGMGEQRWWGARPVQLTVVGAYVAGSLHVFRR